MSVMSIRVDDQKRKVLKVIASIEGRTMSGIIEELIDNYITEFQQLHNTENDITAIIKASEPSFNEWDNDEDAIYDNL